MTEEKTTRRSAMLSWAGIAWGTFAVACGTGTAALVRFMLPNVLFEPSLRFKAGKPEDYEWDTPDERFKQDRHTWIVKLRKDWNGKPRLAALDATCTHLGCTPNVLPHDAVIKCPCHGSAFRFNGINFEGPAPRPLERFAVSLDPVDGQIVVDRSRRFQHEKGEWDHPDAYISVDA